MNIDHANSDVLIIDDQALAQNFLKKSLESLGFKHIKIAESAKHAIHLCEEQEFSIILCSFNLSRDRDGFHLFEEMKVKNYIKLTTTFIFVSAETSPELVNSVIELQPDDFLVKPFTPKELKIRLERVLSRKEKLNTVYFALENKKYRRAIDLIDKHLENPKLAKLAPFLVRIKGDALLATESFYEAEMYYSGLLEKYRFAWASIGLVKALLAQNKDNEAEQILASLVTRAESKLAALDLLGQYHLSKDNFEAAYLDFQQASELSPRNIDRHRNVLNIARLIHDHNAQFETAKSMAKFGKRSIHDSPDLYLTVARAGVDYALTLSEEESTAILRLSERYIDDIKKEFPNSALAKEKINVVKARIHYLKNEQATAQQLIHTVLYGNSASQNIEDDIDKAKAFHELGHKEAAIDILEHIGEADLGNPINQKVMSQFLAQEVKERKEIPYSPRELNNMAVSFYKKNQYEPAIQTFKDALRLMPKNTRIALNFLQVLVDQKLKYGFKDHHEDNYAKCIDILTAGNLDDTQTRRFEILVSKANQKSLKEQA
ncbi:tetratricopeptide repeat-containing response regulator [Algibacillus agarilyticus]|uniref:tetratricopeptide repeat-containing response regulator n=1 Tax=Algibacillus agarilyticus TaxID=2234133 RepID=UPI000DD08B44|nr:tetratricopeptide repeat-containing response regulator [Algibacillus agarilyticus]